MYLLICSRSINSYNIFPSSHIFAVSMSMCNCPHLVYVSLSLREKDFDWLISSLHTKAIHNLDVDWLAFWEKCITGWINYVQKSGGRTVINTRLFFQQGNEWDTFPYEELWAPVSLLTEWHCIALPSLHILLSIFSPSCTRKQSSPAFTEFWWVPKGSSVATTHILCWLLVLLVQHTFTWP